MKKFSKIGKRVLAFFLVALMNINVYATSASNDGSEFVTKAEFDVLVKEFNDNMNNYQAGLNAKIDDSIAKYVSGASGMSKEYRQILFPDAAKEGVLSITKDNPLDYSYGAPLMQGWSYQAFFPSVTSQGNGLSLQEYKFNAANYDKTKHAVNKTTIKNIIGDRTGGSIAEWAGYSFEGYDTISGSLGFMENSYRSGYVDKWVAGQIFVPCQAFQFEDTELIGGENIIMTYKMIKSNGDEATFAPALNYSIYSIDHNWGTTKNSYISVFKPYDYDMFSNRDRDLNWAYDGSYMTTFGGTFENKITFTGSRRVIKPSETGKNELTPWSRGTTGVTTRLAYRTKNSSGVFYPYTTSGSANIGSDYVYHLYDSDKFYVPLVGFETKYLTNWKQIYYGSTETIAKFENDKKSKTANDSILVDDNGDYHLGLTGGFPLMKLDSGERLTYNVKFEDKNLNYVIWVADGPFSRDGHPDGNTRCLQLTGLNKATNTQRGYVVIEGEGTFTTPAFTNEGYVYIKFGINQEEMENIGGGVLMPEEKGLVEVQK